MKLNVKQVAGIRYYILDNEAKLTAYINKWAEPYIQSELIKINRCQNPHVKGLRQRRLADMLSQ